MSRSLLGGLRAARARGELLLIASLPANSTDLASAAVEGGADVLKVHANLEHRASGRRLGSLEEEAERIGAIRAAHPELPLGIVLGAAPETIARDLGLAAELGLDFLSAYVQAMPALAFAGGLELLLAFDALTPPEFAAGLPAGAMLEASVVPADGYGRPLTALDVLGYARLARLTAAPLVVPTQRRVTPADLPALRAARTAGLMFGSIVAGETPGGFREAARGYRAALEGR